MPPATTTTPVKIYRRRDPEASPFYKLVTDHFDELSLPFPKVWWLCFARSIVSSALSSPKIVLDYPASKKGPALFVAKSCRFDLPSTIFETDSQLERADVKSLMANIPVV